MTEPGPRDLRREDFDELSSVTTRWSDNDVFGHLNNAVYLELFDTVLNAWMMRETGIDESVSPVIGVAAHGQWVQVYIDRESRRPVPIPDVVRAHLERSVASREPPGGST